MTFVTINASLGKLNTAFNPSISEFSRITHFHILCFCFCNAEVISYFLQVEKIEVVMCLLFSNYITKTVSVNFTFMVFPPLIKTCPLKSNSPERLSTLFKFRALNPKSTTSQSVPFFANLPNPWGERKNTPPFWPKRLDLAPSQKAIWGFQIHKIGK